MEYNVLIYPDEDGVYTVECVEFPGCISCGNTKEEALENIKEAIQCYCEGVEKEKSKKQKRELVKVTI